MKQHDLILYFSCFVLLHIFVCLFFLSLCVTLVKLADYSDEVKHSTSH